MISKNYYRTMKPGVFIKVTLDYERGGMNYFTSQTIARGYYVTVTPIERGDGFEMTRAFSGMRQCLRQVQRASPSAARQAAELAESVADTLIDVVALRNNLIVVQPTMDGPDE